MSIEQRRVVAREYPQVNNENLEVVSAENVKRIEQSFIQSAIEKGLFANEVEARSAIDLEAEAVEQDMVLSINLNPASVDRLFRLGKQETFWDHLDESGSLQAMSGSNTTQNKSLFGSYTEYRRSAEEVLKGVLPPESQEHNPVYASLAGGTGLDRHMGGSIGYGNVFLELSPAMLDKSALHFNDSFSNVVPGRGDSLAFDPNGLLSKEDAIRAKAIVNLMKQHNGNEATRASIATPGAAEKWVMIEGDAAGYVEVSVFEEVTVEDVQAVGIVLEKQEDFEGIADLLMQHPSLVERARFTIRPEVVGPMTMDWLEAHFPGKVTVRGGAEQREEGASSLWDVLDVNPDSDIAEVQEQINYAAEKIWRSIRFHFSVNDTGKASPKSRLQAIKRKMWKVQSKPKVRERVEQYIQLEQARSFFGVTE